MPSSASASVLLFVPFAASVMNRACLRIAFSNVSSDDPDCSAANCISWSVSMPMPVRPLILCSASPVASRSPTSLVPIATPATAMPATPSAAPFASPPSLLVFRPASSRFRPKLSKPRLLWSTTFRAISS